MGREAERAMFDPSVGELGRETLSCLARSGYASLRRGVSVNEPCLSLSSLFHIFFFKYYFFVELIDVT